jgi:pimeloyl-ACP methyl ester carboxylesterase
MGTGMDQTLRKRRSGTREASRLQPERRGSVAGLSATGFHRVAYVDWGPIDDETPVVCVHGLTRQGRDFDILAADLRSRGRRVVCPDLPGRGRSDWLADPDEYALPQYCADMNALIARLDVDRVDWVGTSLGGLIGIILAGMPGSPIRRLVVNDIGPYVASIGLVRIGHYLREMPEAFPTIEAAEAYFREILAPYGDLTDAQWRLITEHSVHWDAAENAFLMLCDKNIGKAFRNSWFASLNIWKYWEAIPVPTLILHGVQSDLLTRQLTDEMTSRNPNATVVRFEECGHVPPLFERHQIAAVRNFLTGPPPG